ncbi:MAG: hypothetical protein R3272_03470 [Candidatus Promineifilaceae bacterium]|nr:hypothetical protein [Candidatus Promineifilaceae bacterium]
MDQQINELVERVNDFMVRRPGILPLVGVGFILINLLLQFYPGPDVWIAGSNLLLHIGLFLSIVGLLLVNVYRH